MNKEEILEIIANHSSEIVQNLIGHNFKNSDRLSDLGAHSVDRADIIQMTMESLSLQSPRIEFYGAANIGELVDIFYEKVHATRQ